MRLMHVVSDHRHVRVWMRKGNDAVTRGQVGAEGVVTARRPCSPVGTEKAVYQGAGVGKY